MKTKPRIGVIGLKGLPAFGGAATVGENIIKQLKNHYCFTVYAVDSHTDSVGYSEEGGYKQIVFKKSRVSKLNVFFYYFKSAFHAVFKEKFDIVHLHHIDGAYILPILRLKYKVVLTSHARPQVAEKWPWYVRILFRINERVSFRFSNRITVVSEVLKDCYSKMTRKKVYYFPNGIDSTLKPQNSKLGFKNYILFAAGRIIPLKGLHVLLKSIRENPNFGKLLVLGDLEQMPDYKEKILNLAEGLDVQFLGLVKEKGKLLDYISNSKLFVFPSYSENMSIMLLEVASMKTALIASDIPENLAVFNRDEALFFETNNVDDLSNKISFALDNDDEMKNRAGLAHKKLQEYFVWESIAKQYKELFQELVC